MTAERKGLVYGALFVVIGGGAFVLGRLPGWEEKKDSSLPVITQYGVAEKKSAVGTSAWTGEHSTADVENDIADAIMASRQAARDASGGLGPGVHIVDDNGAPLSPDDVRQVPDGTIVNFANIESGSEKFFSLPYDDMPKDQFFVRDAVLSGTGLENAELKKKIADGVYLKGADDATTERLKNLERTQGGRTGWTGSIQVFTGHDPLGTVILEQSDNVAAGTTVSIPRSSINAVVGGLPASLARMKSGNGATGSTLTWAGAGGKTFTVSIKRIDDAAVAELQRMADRLAANNK